MSEQKETPTINRAAYAVADAMMVAQYNLTHSRLKELHDNPSSWEEVNEQERDKLLRQATSGQCLIASLNVIYELVTRHPDLFNYFIILTGIHIPQGDDHVVFLVQSKQGEWFSGSPANHCEGWLTDLFRSDELGEVIEHIEQQGNYTWPNTEFINKNVLRYYVKPEIFNVGNNIHLAVEEGYLSKNGYPMFKSSPHIIQKEIFHPAEN